MCNDDWQSLSRPCVIDREDEKQKSEPECLFYAVIEVIRSLHGDAHDDRQRPRTCQAPDFRHQVSSDDQFFEEWIEERERNEQRGWAPKSFERSDAARRERVQNIVKLVKYVATDHGKSVSNGCHYKPPPNAAQRPVQSEVSKAKPPAGEHVTKKCEAKQFVDACA